MELIQLVSQYLIHFLQFIIHIDSYLISFVSQYGVLAYIVLFAIIFCETGLVITPFLPGDSLLFAAGTIASTEALDIRLLFILLLIASILGNKLNYFIGRALGPRVFANSDPSNKRSRLLNQKHLLRAHQYYERHGGKTIIFARFIPIIRTFAPFVAGVAYMGVREFTFYNCLSALAWIGSLLALGYYFGSLPIIKEHFSLVIYSIIGISLLPPMMAVFMKKYRFGFKSS